MRFREFLIEYSRAKTAEMVGKKLILALATDRSMDLPSPIINARFHIRSIHLQPRHRQGAKTVQDAISAAINDMMTPEEQATLTDQMLAAIEDQDPTPNKAYTPWLARMYIKGGVAMEDMNGNDLLRLFDVAKKRRLIKPEHNDINSFKTYNDFEDTMESVYKDLQDMEADSNDKGKAKKVYEDDNVTIIVPEDEAAACRYGRGTRWCTAATKGHNFFDSYNSRGPLYILIPKHPEHEGEKYQFHFQSNQYMDENDKQVDLTYIFKKRFPNLLEFFLAIPDSGLKDKIMFADDGELQYLIDQVKEFGYRYLDAMSSSSAWMNRHNPTGQIDDLKKMLDVKAERVKIWAGSDKVYDSPPDMRQLVRVMKDTAGSRSDLALDFAYSMRGRLFKGTSGTWGVSR